jgi:pyrrolidone-carboxylate peptidase
LIVVDQFFLPTFLAFYHIPLQHGAAYAAITAASIKFDNFKRMLNGVRAAIETIARVGADINSVSLRVRVKMIPSWLTQV